MDWQKEAKLAANYVVARMPGADRGAMRWRFSGVFCIFGNDGYGDKEDWRNDKLVVREVERVRAMLSEDAPYDSTVTERGFALCKHDYSWAMLVEIKEVRLPEETADGLNYMVWKAWEEVSGEGNRREIAARVIAEHEPLPTEVSN